MAYQWYLVVSEDAQETIDKLSRSNMFLVFSKMIELLYTDNPIDSTQVTDIKKLKAPEYRGLWRKRAGNWRILYRIEESKLIYHNVEYKGKLIIRIS